MFSENTATYKSSSQSEESFNMLQTQCQDEDMRSGRGVNNSHSNIVKKKTCVVAEVSINSHSNIVSVASA